MTSAAPGVTTRTLTLQAADGHEFGAYVATPPGAPRAGLLVLQEIFGVNAHIRRVAEGYAARDYLAIAPALFDRVRPGIELGYDAVEQGRDLMLKLAIDDVAADLRAAVAAVGTAGRVGAVGYCWGGAIADLAACRTSVAAAVSYYGRANVAWLHEQPRCPVLYHFGALDPLIPPEVVSQITAARPGHAVHVYEQAGHGFNCDERPEYHAPSAALALQRTLAFFDQHLG
ncbi:MAG: dienelactone hydrolase family protein [Chromatiales bacterium]|jgi:carboxymethylenebutenolidase|nr:dienelactone hydrolase family protein [Chromatiales bacterium]